MQQKSDTVLLGYVKELCEDIRRQYTISPDQFDLESVKRGLRNADGTGVLAGVTRIGSVRGYQMIDGAPEPTEGRLFYRGIRGGGDRNGSDIGAYGFGSEFHRVRAEGTGFIVENRGSGHRVYHLRVLGGGDEI